jgi:hypothetical protein
VVGGLLLSQFLTLFLTPVVYLGLPPLIAWLREVALWLRRGMRGEAPRLSFHGAGA